MIKNEQRVAPGAPVVEQQVAPKSTLQQPKYSGCSTPNGDWSKYTKGFHTSHPGGLGNSVKKPAPKQLSHKKYCAHTVYI